MSLYHYSSNADESIFYQCFKKQFESLWHTTSREQKTVCIPPDDDARYVFTTMSRDTSKLQTFIRQYTTEAGKELAEREVNKSRFNKSKSLSGFSFRRIFDTRTQQQEEELEKPPIKLLETTKGFRNNFVVNVVGCDTFYNDDFQPFTIWFIDRCITDDHESIRQAAKRISASGQNNKRFSLAQKAKDPTTEQEFHEFLKHADGDIYSSCMRCIVHFNKNYVLMSGYQKQVVDWIRDNYDQLVGDFVNSSSDVYTSNDQYMTNFKNAIMSVLVSGIYEKIFAYWTKTYLNEDRLLWTQQKAVSGLSFDDLEIPKPFQCPQDEAVHYLQQLDECRSSFEKMKCLKRTSELILDTVNSHQKDTISTSQEVLTSDELVPLFTFVLSRARLSHLASNISLINEFSVDEISSSEYGYAMTSFEVAVEYLKRRATDLGVLEAEPLPVEEDKTTPLSPEELRRPHTHRGIIPQRYTTVERREKGYSLSSSLVDFNYMDRDRQLGSPRRTESPSRVKSPRTRTKQHTSEQQQQQQQQRSQARSKPILSRSYSVDIIKAFAHRATPDSDDEEQKGDVNQGTSQEQSMSPVDAKTPPSRIVFDKSKRSGGLGTFVNSLIDEN